jgi:hypothetical protein
MNTTSQSDDGKSSPEPERKNPDSEANACIGIGAAVGVIGATAAAITGAVCPICIVATPGLIGVGVYRRWRSRASNRGKATTQ